MPVSHRDIVRSLPRREKSHTDTGFLDSPTPGPQNCPDQVGQTRQLHQGDVHTLRGQQASDVGKRARGGTRTAFAPPRKHTESGLIRHRYDPVLSPKCIESHRRAIRLHKAGLDDIPAVNVVAPVARRVVPGRPPKDKKGSRAEAWIGRHDDTRGASSSDCRWPVPPSRYEHSNSGSSDQ